MFSSLLQNGAEAAARAALLLYAVECGDPTRHFQTLSFGRHDTLRLPCRYNRQQN